MVLRPGLKSLTFVLVTLTAVETIAPDASRSAMTLVVDQTQAARRIAFVHEDIRVQPICRSAFKGAVVAVG